MKLRDNNLEKLDHGYFDAIIIGGGINGAVSANALAARGARVALIDRGDFGSLSSQESSNLAWGGIKYLENFEFSLVRKLCKSRNKLIENYPSTVKEIRFYMPHARDFRKPRFLLYLGSWLYWVMGSFFTKPPRLLSVYNISKEEPKVRLSGIDGGIEYSDAYFHDNDTRFVFNFIRTALNYGAIAANYVESLGAKRNEKGLWEVRAKDLEGERGEFTITGKVLINACGAYVDEHNERAGLSTTHSHLLSKGIHLIVNRIVKSKRVLTFFGNDGRLFFAIPMGPKTCIGTTDTRLPSPETEITHEDRQFVLDNINDRMNFEKPLTKDDIIGERCGVRPLVSPKGSGDAADWMNLSRKHVIETHAEERHASIFGGKLTDCVNVGDEICDLYENKFGIDLPFENRKWYGEPLGETKEEFFHQARLMKLDTLTAKESSERLSKRLWRRYWGQAIGILERIREDPSMAEVLIKGSEYIRAEISQAARREMITTLDDFLRRRSKIALIAPLEDIKSSPGLMEACKMFFGDKAQEKYDAYFLGRQKND